MAKPAINMPRAGRFDSDSAAKRPIAITLMKAAMPMITDGSGAIPSAALPKPGRQAGADRQRQRRAGEQRVNQKTDTDQH